MIFLIILFVSSGSFTETSDWFGFSQQYGEYVVTASRHNGVTYWSDWIDWRRVHNKNYPKDVEALRFNHWSSNLQKIAAHNARYSTGQEFYMQGATKFADSDPNELKRNLLIDVPLSNFFEKLTPVELPEQPVPSAKSYNRLGWTRSYNCRQRGSSGWAFSASAAVQGYMFNATGKFEKLSVFELEDCVRHPGDRYFLSIDSFSYIMEEGLTSFYQYGLSFNKFASCKRNPQHPATKIQKFHVLQPDDEENLKRAVALIGPVAASIKVTSNFFFYQYGVFYDPNCNQGNSINHAVLIVGYGTDTVHGDYWLIQNSWGKQWGTSGFGKMARNSIFNCGIASAAVYPVV